MLATAGFIEYEDTQQASAQMLLRLFNRKKLSFHDRHLLFVDDYIGWSSSFKANVAMA